MYIDNQYIEYLLSVYDFFDLFLAMIRVKFIQNYRFATKTQRDDIYFNLSALESLWLNE